MRTGTGIEAGIFGINFANAFGPPVETPITSILTGARSLFVVKRVGVRVSRTGFSGSTFALSGFRGDEEGEVKRRDGVGDDLTQIKGVGPKLAKLCNTHGFYHFDQIAAWTADEVAWVDDNLEGFKGRVSRDEWVAQAKVLAAGGPPA
jgi:hypothetical protein